jgi:hypothetical protein
MTEGIDFIDALPSGFRRSSWIYFEKQNQPFFACLFSRSVKMC